MRILTTQGLSVGLACMPALGALAANDGMGGAMAKCTSSDPAVIVNLKKMTFMMDTKPNRVAMKGMMNHDTFVCKSAAAKMGAKLKSGPSTMMKKPAGKM